MSNTANFLRFESWFRVLTHDFVFTVRTHFVYFIQCFFFLFNLFAVSFPRLKISNEFTFATLNVCCVCCCCCCNISFFYLLIFFFSLLFVYLICNFRLSKVHANILRDEQHQLGVLHANTTIKYMKEENTEYTMANVLESRVCMLYGAYYFIAESERI